jgi:hypothetical protein
LSPAAEQDHHRLVTLDEIQPIAGAVVDPHLRHAAAYRLHLAPVCPLKAVQTNIDIGSSINDRRVAPYPTDQRQHKPHSNDGGGDKRARDAGRQETEANEDQGHDPKVTAAHQHLPKMQTLPDCA